MATSPTATEVPMGLDIIAMLYDYMLGAGNLNRGLWTDVGLIDPTMLGLPAGQPIKTLEREMFEKEWDLKMKAFEMEKMQMANSAAASAARAAAEGKLADAQIAQMQAQVGVETAKLAFLKEQWAAEHELNIKRFGLDEANAKLQQKIANHQIELDWQSLDLQKQRLNMDESQFARNLAFQALSLRSANNIADKKLKLEALGVITQLSGPGDWIKHNYAWNYLTSPEPSGQANVGGGLGWLDLPEDILNGPSMPQTPTVPTTPTTPTVPTTPTTPTTPTEEVPTTPTTPTTPIIPQNPMTTTEKQAHEQFMQNALGQGPVVNPRRVTPDPMANVPTRPKNPAYMESLNERADYGQRFFVERGVGANMGPNGPTSKIDSAKWMNPDNDQWYDIRPELYGAHQNDIRAALGLPKAMAEGGTVNEGGTHLVGDVKDKILEWLSTANQNQPTRNINMVGHNRTYGGANQPQQNKFATGDRTASIGNFGAGTSDPTTWGQGPTMKMRNSVGDFNDYWKQLSNTYGWTVGPDGSIQGVDPNEQVYLKQFQNSQDRVGSRYADQPTHWNPQTKSWQTSPYAFLGGEDGVSQTGGNTSGGNTAIKKTPPYAGESEPPLQPTPKPVPDPMNIPMPQAPAPLPNTQPEPAPQQSDEMFSVNQDRLSGLVASYSNQAVKALASGDTNQFNMFKSKATQALNWWQLRNSIPDIDMSQGGVQVFSPTEGTTFLLTTRGSVPLSAMQIMWLRASGAPIVGQRPPQYSAGTGSHPGGLAVVGDLQLPPFRVNLETIKYPDGQSELVGLSGEETKWLPRGTEVIPHGDPRDNNIPRYATGTDRGAQQKAATLAALKNRVETGAPAGTPIVQPTNIRVPTQQTTQTQTQSTPTVDTRTKAQIRAARARRRARKNPLTTPTQTGTNTAGSATPTGGTQVNIPKSTGPTSTGQQAQSAQGIQRTAYSNNYESPVAINSIFGGNNIYTKDNLNQMPLIQKLRGNWTGTTPANMQTGLVASNQGFGISNMPLNLNMRDFLRFSPSEQEMSKGLFQDGLGQWWDDILARMADQAPVGNSSGVNMYGI